MNPLKDSFALRYFITRVWVKSSFWIQKILNSEKTRCPMVCIILLRGSLISTKAIFIWFWLHRTALIPCFSNTLLVHFPPQTATYHLDWRYRLVIRSTPHNLVDNLWNAGLPHPRERQTAGRLLLRMNLSLGTESSKVVLSKTDGCRDEPADPLLR